MADFRKIIQLQSRVAALEEGGGGSDPLDIQHTTVVLTDAQIKQSGLASNVELLPGVAGKFYMLIGGGVWSNIVTPYTNQDNLREITLGYNDDYDDASMPVHGISAGSTSALLSASCYQAILPGSANIGVIAPLLQPPPPIGDILGKNLSLYVDNPDGAFTGGHADNTLTFLIHYVLVTP